MNVRRLATSGTLALAVVATSLSLSSTAQARSVVKSHGAHPRYSVEIEPHLLLQWSAAPWGDDGFGPGVRFNIPIVESGPIKTINNSMAIGFGADWAIFNDVCGWYWRFYRLDGPAPDVVYDCSANTLWFPAALQWNFFLTDIISVFGEPGLAIQHFWWDSDFCDGPGCDGSDTNLKLVFWGGGRFLLGDSVSIIARIGTPYISAGVSFLL